MKYRTRALLTAGLLLVLGATDARGQCTVALLDAPTKLAKTSLVIDVRPDEINQFKGKYSFRDQAHIALVNMNPFLFSYRIKVDQTEIQDTGFLNFLSLLGSPVTDLIGAPASAGRNAKLRETAGGSLQRLITRTASPALAGTCTAALKSDAEKALEELGLVRQEVLKKREEVAADLGTEAGNYKGARGAFDAEKGIIFNASVEAKDLCDSSNRLFRGLAGNAYPSVETMTELKKDVTDFRSLVNELRESAEDYNNAYEDCPARAGGLSYPDNLVRLANELDALGAAYEARVNGLLNETKGYDALKEAISSLEAEIPDPENPGVKKKVNRKLQRQYTVFGRYDISALDITVTPEPLGADSGLPVRRDLDNLPPQDVVGDIQSAGRGRVAPQSSVRLINAGAGEVGSGARVFAPHVGRAASAGADAADGGGDGGSGGGGGNGNGGGGGDDEGGKAIRTSGTIGDRRFEVSGGMVFSSLGRREFQSVLGYRRNEQGEIVDDEGNPTDQRELTSIVGVSEDSGRRISPIGMLHYRFPYARNFFASVGVTGKRDSAGTDIEYLLGPSFLYRNMFFTVGGYAGKQQRLAGDLFLGAKLEDDSVPVRKDYRWGLGFAFTYKIPLGETKSER